MKKNALKGEHMTRSQEHFEHYAYLMESIADGHESHDPDACRQLKSCANGLRGAAIGHARYEALRKIKLPEFVELLRRNLAGENFHDMVDELVKAKNEHK